MTVSYESFYGLVERPFSLTPDPKYLFKSRAHGRALEVLTFGLRRGDPFLLLTGDVGVGKTTICRTLVEQLRRRGPVAYAATPMRSPAELMRLLLHDIGALSAEELRTSPVDGSAEGLLDRFASFACSGEQPRGGVLVIDEAHGTPTVLVDVLRRLSSVTAGGTRALQIVFAAQPWGEQSPALQTLDPDTSTKARLLPFGRDDCAAYVTHRLAIAGGGGVAFSTRAVDVLFGLSGGVPRLINLLCDRALQEGAAAQARKIEPVFVETAASALELLRARPKRFRWFHKQVG